MSRIIVAGKTAGKIKNGANKGKPYLSVKLMEDGFLSEDIATRSFYSPAMIARYEAINEGDVLPDVEGKIRKVTVAEYQTQWGPQTAVRVFIPVGETVEMAILASGHKLPAKATEALVESEA